MLRKLTAVALVVGLVAVSAFAQGTARNVRNEKEASRTTSDVTASHVYSELDIQASLHDQTPVSVILTDGHDSEPLNLTRSFRDALKENVDKESLTRQVK